MSYASSFLIGHETFMFGSYMWAVYGSNSTLEAKIDAKGGSTCILVHKAVKANYIRSIGR